MVIINLLLLVSSLCGVLGILYFMNPLDAGPVGVLLFFTTLYVLFYSLTYFFFLLFRKLRGRKGNTQKLDFVLSLIIGFAPVFFLLLKSFGLNLLISFCVCFVTVFLACFLAKNRFSVIK